MVLCIVPKIQPDAPTVGPAMLKANLEAAGYSCAVYDFNIKLYNFLLEKDLHKKYFFDDDSIFATINNTLTEEFESFYEENIGVFDEFVNYLKLKNPKWVGFSLLSDYSKTVALKLSQLVKQELPNTKIVWGGAQIGKRTREIKKLGYCDHYIVGDGENAILELLGGNLSAEGIDENGATQIHNLNTVKMPNYDEIDWNEYHNFGFDKTVYITGSRGCVKDCIFCCVNDLWPKFVFRTTDNISAEIQYLQENYDRKTFKFTDSLVNGSIKNYINLIDNFIKFKEADPEFGWTGQWIVRNQKQMDETHYEKLGKSGILSLEIGIETFSEPVRFHMGKKFIDEELWWCLGMLRKYNIPQTLLLITGYPTETDADHQKTVDGLRRLEREGFIWGDNGEQLINISFTPMLLDKWTAEKFSDNMSEYNDYRDWKYLNNDKETRIQRYVEIIGIIEEITKKEIGWRTIKDLNRYKK